MKKLMFFSLLISMFWLSSTLAATVTSLYSGRVMVTSESSQVREAAIPQALEQVLVKVSGNSQIAESAEIKEQLADADKWVEQYSYQSQNKTNEEGITQLNTYLRVQFNSNAVNQLILDNGYAIWGKSRPSILLLIVVENAQGRYLIGSDTSAVMDAVEEQAKSRGLSVTLPLLDLTDLNTINTDNTWALNEESLKMTSQRYGSDGVAVARITETDAQHWSANWALIIQNETQNWQTNADSLNAVLQQGVNTMADDLAASYGVKGNNSAADDVTTQQVVVKVTQVNSALAYNELTRYLQSLASVKRAQVIKLDSDAVYFNVQLVGSEQAFIKALSLNKRLLSADAAAVAAEPEPGVIPNTNMAAEDTKYYWSEKPALPKPFTGSAYDSGSSDQAVTAHDVDLTYQWVS